MNSSDNEPSRPCYDLPTLKNPKSIRKRTGATWWTQRLCNGVEKFIKGVLHYPSNSYPQPMSETEAKVILGQELSIWVWNTISTCDEAGKRHLKEEDKKKAKREKKKRRKNKDRSRKSKKGKRKGWSYSSSDSSPYSSGSSSSSSAASSQRPTPGPQRAPPRGSRQSRR